MMDSEEIAEFATATGVYLKHLTLDYRKFLERIHRDDTEKIDNLVKLFAQRTSFTISHRFIKVETPDRAHSFIAVKDTRNYRKGDILAPKTYNSPSVDRVYGNVLQKQFGGISWTGINVAPRM